MNRKSIAVIGLGLLGTSLARALYGHPDYRVLAWARRQETRCWARENRIADCVFDTLPEILSACDLVVLCLPVESAITMLPVCAEYLPPHAVVTDIGSVKGAICRAAASYPALRFVGSHPMAGTEKSGCEAAFAALYRNADVFVVPPENGDPENVELCRKLWLDAGAARVEQISAEAHDELVADTSHVLHILASAMSLSILEAATPDGQRRHFAGCATGFRDTTRIASSNPVMWREIVESNSQAVLAALDRFEERYRQFRSTIESGDFDRFESLFARGRLLRNAWLGYKRPRPARLLICGIKHCGKSSTGKALAQLLGVNFIDSDEQMLEVWKARHPESEISTIRELYRNIGEEQFRKLEADVLEALSATSDAMVLTPGGGALSNPFVSGTVLKKLGCIVWIDVPDQVAWQRITAGGIPPFLAGSADPEAEFIRANGERRKQFEALADLKITPGKDDSPRDNALHILELLENIN